MPDTAFSLHGRTEGFAGFDRSQGGAVLGVDLSDGRDAHSQISNQPVSQAVDPAVNGQLLTPFPRIPNNGGLTDIADLLDDIELAEPIGLQLLSTHRSHARQMFFRNVLNVAKPV